MSTKADLAGNTGGDTEVGDTWVLADVRSVQRFIFETDVLAQMRGASALVRGFDDFVASAVIACEGELEIGLGGTYRVRFSTRGDATRFEQQLRDNFETTVGLPATRLSTVVVPFSSDRAHAYLALSEARSRRVAIVSPPPPLTHPCAICRRRASSAAVVLPGPETVLACAVCKKRQDAARTVPGRREVRDLGEFARSSQPRGYIAVLVADGDGIGRQLQEASDDSALSATLGRSTNAAVEAVDRVCDGRIVRQWVGGDDAVLVVHPQGALTAASTLIRTFNAEASSGDVHITMSCGVVITHASMPFSNILTLGEQLLDNAKKARRTSGDGYVGVGFIDAEMTSSSASSGLDRLREGRTVKPMSVTATDGELDALTSALRVLVERRVSRSLVRRIHLPEVWDDLDGDVRRSLHAELIRLPGLASLPSDMAPVTAEGREALHEQLNRLKQLHEIRLG